MLDANEADIKFFLSIVMNVVPYCLRQYLGPAVRCRRHEFFPMMNNLFVNSRSVNLLLRGANRLNNSENITREVHCFHASPSSS